MAKVKQPNKEFWNSDKKPENMEIVKLENVKMRKDEFTHAVKVKRKI